MSGTPRLTRRRVAGTSGAEPAVGQAAESASGRSFVFTGQLKSLSLVEAQELVYEIGGTVTEHLTSETGYLVKGVDGDKQELAVAHNLGITVLSESDLLSLIDKRTQSHAPVSPGSSSTTRKTGDGDVGKAKVFPPGQGPFTWGELWPALAVLLVGMGATYLYMRGRMREVVPASLDGLRLPPTSQAVDLKALNVLDTVPPPHKHHGKMIFVPPGMTNESMLAQPFHIYDPEFLPVIGLQPTLTLIAEQDEGLPFHEATVWYPPTDEFFFCQNAGAKLAGTGMAKSAVVQKIDLQQAERVRLEARGEKVKVSVVSHGPDPIVNPNGGTNWNGQIVFCAEGQGDDITSGLVLMNPLEPHNTTLLLNNYHGRQFNSLNDVATNPRNHELYFTDTVYGYLQDFRPKPGMRSQVYRFDPKSGQVAAVADGFDKPNGIAFSPSGKHAYIADTGVSSGFYGNDFTAPATIYRFDVHKDGTWGNRQLFAYISVGIPDGIHCDDKGNVYAGIGDGVGVWNPSGKLIGKIFVGGVVANFQFAGRGRMIILAESKLWYATLRAKGADIHDL